jgi:rare lipoprotein A
VSLRAILSLGLAAGLLLAGCAHRGPSAPTEPPRKGSREKGDASWYGHPYHGRQTASGETYDMHDLTAAHRTLPFGTVVRVERRDTGADVTVRINDRGPFVRGRIIDLSFKAARKIGLDVDGVAPVTVTVVGFEETPPRRPPPRRSSDRGPECAWVQVGAFGDPGNARRAVEWLRGEGYTVVVVEGPDGLDRVRVGPFDDLDEAERALGKLRRRYPPAAVVACG